MTRPQLGGLSSELKTAARFVDRALPREMRVGVSLNLFVSTDKAKLKDR